MGNFHKVSGGIILEYFLLPIKKLSKCLLLTFPKRWLHFSPYQLQIDNKKKSYEKGSH